MCALRVDIVQIYYNKGRILAKIDTLGNMFTNIIILEKINTRCRLTESTSV